MATKISITLSSANLGNQSTEADFDAWAAYVNEHIDEALGLVTEVDQFAFTGRGFEAEDRIDGATDEQAEEIERWLSNEGWEAFCSAWGAVSDAQRREAARDSA